jgi:hypothetical protein
MNEKESGRIRRRLLRQYMTHGFEVVWKKPRYILAQYTVLWAQNQIWNFQSYRLHDLGIINTVHERVNLAVTLFILIREIFDSNIGQDIDDTSLGSSWFYSLPPGKLFSNRLQFIIHFQFQHSML